MARRIVLIGAGGHARVCLEAALDDADVEVVGALSRDGTGVDRLGVPVIGTDVDTRLAALIADGTVRAHVAIGDNLARSEAAGRWRAAGGELHTCTSRFAMVSPTARIGDGCALLPGAIVTAQARLGDGVILNTGASVDHDGEVGPFAHVGPGAVLAGAVSVGARAFIGMGARILPGRRVGDLAVVGAGAVVIADVPDGATVVGVPARQVAQR